METNILKFELTATRHVDDNTPDTITAHRYPCRGR